MAAKDPLCFVLMPFGVKPGLTAQPINFDAIYAELIAPAILEAKLEPIRADEEQGGGIIHTPMFERLLLCDYAIADLTTANANVFYELGVRHAVRPRSTVLMFAEGGGQLPFDVRMLRALPYKIGSDGAPTDVVAQREALVKKLMEAKSQAGADSPLYQLLQDYPNISHEKTDVFRDRVAYSQSLKERLAKARALNTGAIAALQAIENELQPVSEAEFGVVVDLLLSYRAIKAWEEMIALVGKMSPPLRGSVLVQEQYGFALNRQGRGDEAERVLKELISTRGPSSETFGLLGRVYKDRWEHANNCGDKALARGLLKKAIDAYRKGFETDWRDAYPGVNAATLMELVDPPDPDRLKMLPVVRYAVERKMASDKADYWDFATKLELAVLAKDQAEAESALADALAVAREGWELETTLRNLRLIREARQERAEPVDWAQAIEGSLARRMQDFAVKPAG